MDRDIDKTLTVTFIEKKHEQMYSTSSTYHLNQLVTDEQIYQ
jgi:hypothetical protein